MSLTKLILDGAYNYYCAAFNIITDFSDYDFGTLQICVWVDEELVEVVSADASSDIHNIIENLKIKYYSLCN